MTVWSHLLNAKHIDRVLTSVKSQPELWEQVRALAWDSKWYKVWGQAWHQARDQVWDQGREQVWDLTSVPTLQDPAWQRARARARGALLALIAYDDSAKYLDLPLDQLQMLYHLTDHPACILLQPAVFVFEKEKELV